MQHRCKSRSETIITKLGSPKLTASITHPARQCPVGKQDRKRLNKFAAMLSVDIESCDTVDVHLAASVMDRRDNGFAVTHCLDIYESEAFARARHGINGRSMPNPSQIFFWNEPQEVDICRGRRAFG